MITPQDLTSILATYELPPAVAARVERIAAYEIREQRLCGFDALYRRIAELVDIVTVPYEERYSLRLDHQPPASRFAAQHHLFEELSIHSESDQREGNYLAPREAFDRMFARLTASQQIMLQHLVRESRKQERERSSDTDEEYTVPVDVLQSSSSLVSRIDAIAHTFTAEGKILIPRRPIVYIRWNPSLWVKYGRRNFGGNPLQFYRDNIDVYDQCKTRLALRRFDYGLLEALRRAGQLDNAIPAVPLGEQSRVKLTEAQEAEIVIAYRAHRKSIRAIKRNISFTAYDEVIKRCLRKHDLEIREPCWQPSIPSNEQERIRQAFVTYGSATEAAEHVPYSMRTILKYARLGGLTPRQKGSRVHGNLPVQRQQAIDDAFTCCAGNISEAARRTGHGRDAIRRRWVEKGYIS